MQTMCVMTFVDDRMFLGADEDEVDRMIEHRRQGLYLDIMRRIANTDDHHLYYFKFRFRIEHQPYDRRHRLELVAHPALIQGYPSHIYETPEPAFVPVRSNVFPQNPMAHFFEETEETPMRAIER
jgi:hypothetical protein